MEKVIDFPNRDSIETEACAWISQLDGDRAPSAEDIAALQEWINRSPLHRQELQRLAELWGDLNMLTELAPDLDSLAAPNQPSFIGKLLTPIFGPLFAPRLPLATALASALVLIISMVVWNDFKRTEPSHHMFTTQVGEQRLAQLPDGSSVQINTNSQVEIDFTRDKRKVRLLKGEAHFSVAHDKSRPFEVFAGSGMVRAVGTAFSVYLKDQQVEVTVTEGRVEIAPSVENAIAAIDSSTGNVGGNSADNSIGNSANREAGQQPTQTAQPQKTAQLTQLSAGQNIRFNHHIEPIQTLRQDQVARKLSWRDGMLVFSGESLEQVVAEVSRYTTQSIVITDASIRDIRIGGYFKAGETQAMFDALETSFGVQVSRIDSGLVHLSRAQIAEQQ